MARCPAELAPIAIVVAIAATPAHADPRPMVDEARRELERGQAQFEAHDYAGAIASYDVGFAIDPHPDFLYAKGQAQRLGGDCAGAIQSYHGFLASSPPEAEARVTRYNIARCERTLAAARQAEGPREAWYRDPLGGVLAAGAAIALGTATAYLIVADGHVDNANDADGLEDYYYESDLARSDRKIGTIGLIGGGALAIGAVLRYALHERDRVQVTGVVTASGGAVMLGGRF